MTHNGQNLRAKRNAAAHLATLSSAALSCLALALTGCGIGGGTGTGAGSSGSGITASVHMQGLVHGGQQPVTGATIQLYQISNAGYGATASPLLPTGSSAVKTDQYGGFNLLGLYSCQPNAMVYIVATGGNPGMAPGTNNASLALMTGLGSCATLLANGLNTFITINEVTTVATAYALSAYMTGYANAGYTGSSLSGLNNAFLTENAIVSTTTGAATAAAAVANITYPQLAINSLADSIAPCINSGGGNQVSCGQLFTAATPTGGSAPTDTIGAILNIVHNPSINVSKIWTLATPTSPFAPTLTSSPIDWTLPIIYSGGGLATPTGIALDASNNAWVANAGGNAITEVQAGGVAGAPQSYTATTGTFVGPEGIAVDSLGNVWVANTGANNVVELSAGVVSKTITSGISGPLSVAFDTSNNVWVTNFDSSSVAAFSNSTGNPLSGSPYTNTAVSAPTGLSIDANNNVWVASSGTGTVAKFNASGVYQASYTDGLLVAPGALAYDPTTGNTYAAATGISAITALTSTGAGSTLSAAGTVAPLGVATDGAGNVWTAGATTGGTLSEFSSAGTLLTPAAGIASLNAPAALAIDASGNLWTADSGDSTVTEIVGIAAPTATPIVP